MMDSTGEHVNTIQMASLPNEETNLVEMACDGTVPPHVVEEEMLLQMDLELDKRLSQLAKLRLGPPHTLTRAPRNTVISTRPRLHTQAVNGQQKSGLPATRQKFGAVMVVNGCIEEPNRDISRNLKSQAASVRTKSGSHSGNIKYIQNQVHFAGVDEDCDYEDRRSGTRKSSVSSSSQSRASDDELFQVHSSGGKDANCRPSSSSSNLVIGQSDGKLGGERTISQDFISEPETCSVVGENDCCASTSYFKIIKHLPTDNLPGVATDQASVGTHVQDESHKENGSAQGEATTNEEVEIEDEKEQDGDMTDEREEAIFDEFLDQSTRFRISTLTKKVNALTEALRLSQEECKRLASVKREAATAAQKAETERRNMSKQVTALQQETSKQQKSNKHLQERIKELKSDRQALRKELSAKRQSECGVRSTQSSLQAQLTRSRADNADLRDQMTKLKDRHKEEVDQLRASVSASTSKIRQLERQQRNMSALMKKQENLILVLNEQKNNIAVAKAAASLEEKFLAIVAPLQPP